MQTPPGPRGLPVVGNVPRFARDPFAFLTAVGRAYPNSDVVAIRLGPRRSYLLTNPRDVETVLVRDADRYRKAEFGDDAVYDLLGSGLLLSEGETWRRRRDLAAPAFRGDRIAGYADLMVRYTERMLDGWRAGESYAVDREMAQLTVRIIVGAMFGTELDDATVRRLPEVLEPVGRRFEPDPLRMLLPDWAPTRENREFDAAVRELERVVDDIVASADDRDTDPDDEAGANGDGDLLSTLLRARRAGELSSRGLRDELITMLLAGHDTTALALTYAWHLLAAHPEAEARLHDEVDRVLDGRPPAFSDLPELEYTERVVTEAMRLYPPVFSIFRQPKIDVELGGYRVPRGSLLLLPQWVIHRHPDHYDDPEAFDPDRWLPERARDRPRYAYFPFGAGPRHCIGRRFAMVEAKLVLAAVARRYRLVGGGELDLRASITTHPRDPVEMTAVERD